MDGRFGDDLLLLHTDFSGNLQIVTSVGDDAFSAAYATHYLRPERPHSLVVEDFDGDGDRDVFWTVQEEASVNRIHVLWNDGTGGLGDPWMRYLSESSARNASAGDLDGDGVLDLAMATRQWDSTDPYRVAILFGDDLRACRRLHAGRAASPMAAAGADPGPRLRSMHPNPAGQDVLVAFTLGRRAPATLELFDLAGRRVLAERLAEAEAGEHALRLGLPPALRAGIYWLALRQGGAVSTRRLTVMR
jgi:hypothetical protein